VRVETTMDQADDNDQQIEGGSADVPATCPLPTTPCADEPSAGERLFYEEQQEEARGTKRPLNEIEREEGHFTILPFGIDASWGGTNGATATVTFLHADVSFCIVGRAAVKCIEGSAEVMGHILTPDDAKEVVVTSPFWSSWIPFHSNIATTRLELRSIRGNPTSFRLAPPTRAVVIPPSWKTTVDQIVTDFNNAGVPIKDSLEEESSYRHAKQEVLICGAKGVGKSTLLRYLTNRLLSKNSESTRIEQVAILDADVGQPELSPPGVLRLSLQDTSLLRTPYWNLVTPINTVASVYYGAVTSSVDPTRYIEGVQTLIQAYRDYIAKVPTRIPLIINMDGWIKGLGYQVLTAVMNNIQPSHVCQLIGETRGQTFDLEQSEESTSFFLEACTKHVVSPCIIPSRTLRTIRLGAYFAPHLLEGWDAIDTADAKELQSGWEDEECTLAHYLASERPYCVPFEAVTCSWSSTDLQGELQSTEDSLLQAMNGCIVGLNTANDDCLGLGIIRSIDWYKRVFYILTPVDGSILPQVTKLVGGHLPLPAPFLFRGFYAESFPYMTMPKTGDTVTALGADPMKSKHTLARKGLMGAQQSTSNKSGTN
jgi:polynucleotide 5'-hydroxyl-kinase GRC3/NOL9